ncbi:polysaccharide deacetylase family protein [Oceanobacter mangrovi]|uniref:polysaccharide deacetylase family protein n=1 Tax=Oceanobacter mangrovi TaxID=2862510 RepID=UPI001C8DD1CE|nr:polysaccharide deacetylase family protein [Oceanobacter mangrovi]
MKRLINTITGSLAPFATGLKSRKLVLCYHRFSSPGYTDAFPSPVSTTPAAELEKQIRWLASFADFVTLDTLASSKHNPRWQIAITIDDGYKDVLDLGMPLFEKHQVPVTWFIATKAVQDPKWIPWWDLSAWLGNQGKGKLNLNDSILNGEFDLSNKTQVGHICSTLRKRALSDTKQGLDNLVANIVTQLNIPANAFCRPTELKAAQTSSFLQLAPHTHSHPNLALLTAEQQRREFEESFKLLSSWEASPQNWLAYPFGKEWARNQETLKIVEELGFKGACTTNIDYASEQGNRYTIPRISIDGRWDLQTFKSRVVFAPLKNRLKKRFN